MIFQYTYISLKKHGEGRKYKYFQCIPELYERNKIFEILTLEMGTTSRHVSGGVYLVRRQLI